MVKTIMPKYNDFDLKEWKKLDNINNLLEEKKAELFSLWQDGLYRTICDNVILSIKEKKIA